MLFIPYGWWHCANGIGRNISVNFWFKASARHVIQLPRQKMRVLLYFSARMMRRHAYRIKRWGKKLVANSAAHGTEPPLKR